MKKIFKSIMFLLICGLVLPQFVVSCNSNDDGKNQLYALVTFVTGGSIVNDYYAVLDNGETIYFSDKSNFAQYTPKNGQRAVIYFKELNEPVTGFKYNAKLLAINEILTKDVITVNEQQYYDTLGTNGIGITSATISGGYLNLDVSVEHALGAVHYFNAVNNKVPAEKPEADDKDYVVLEFHHKIKEVSLMDRTAYTSVCFRLNEFNPEVVGKKGIIIKYTKLDKTPATITVEKKAEPTPAK